MVYLARQEQPIARQVALKVIKLGMDTRASYRAFSSKVRPWRSWITRLLQESSTPAARRRAGP